jgi:tetratricopeptide (TPR) repeat protein
MLAVLGAGGTALAQYREYFIRGRVVDTEKRPIAGVAIRLMDQATSRSFDMKTGKDGGFKFAGLPHGIYQATLTRDGYPTTKVEWRFESPQDSMQKVEIPEIVLASQEQVQKVARVKEAESVVKDAAEQIQRGALDDALPALAALVEKEPGNVNAWYFLGLGRAGKHEYREAAFALSRVTELQPSFPGAYFELGVCEQHLNDAEKALASFERSLAIDPKNADAAYNAGLLLFQANRVDEAAARFEQGLETRPEDPELLEMAGRCDVHAGKLERARERLEKARAFATDPAKAAFLRDLLAQIQASMTSVK